jgi:hypothetical protein
LSKGIGEEEKMDKKRAPFPPEAPENLGRLADEWCRMAEGMPCDCLAAVRPLREDEPDYVPRWDYSLDSILVLRGLVAAICGQDDSTWSPEVRRRFLCVAGAYWGETLIRMDEKFPPEPDGKCEWKRCSRAGCRSWVRDQCPGWLVRGAGCTIGSLLTDHLPKPEKLKRKAGKSKKPDRRPPGDKTKATSTGAVSGSAANHLKKEM